MSGFSPASRNKSVEDIRKELEFKSGSNKKLSLDDLLHDDESSDDTIAPSTTATPSAPSRSSKVEELLKNLDLSSDDEVTPSSSGNETQQQRPKIPVQLSKKQIDLFTATSTTDKDMKTFLDLFEVTELPKDQQVREECREILKNLTKETQREVIYKLLGSRPLVEEVNPEQYYPFVVEKLKGKKLEEFHQLLQEVQILGRISTSEERQLLIEKYNPTDKTALEIEREEYLQQLTRTSYDYCVTEQDYDQVYTARYDESLSLRYADHALLSFAS